MIVAIKFFVNGSVFYPEIGAEIDHARAGRQKRFGKFGGESVRQSQKNYFRVTGQLFRIGFTEPERVGFFNMGKTRKDLGKCFAGELRRSRIILATPPKAFGADPPFGACHRRRYNANFPAWMLFILSASRFSQSSGSFLRLFFSTFSVFGFARALPTRPSGWERWSACGCGACRSD